MPNTACRSFRAQIRILSLLACAALRAALADDILLDAALIKTSGEPAYGSFYGYRTVSEGPGTSAFADLKAKATADHVPLFVVWTAPGCNHCSGFADNMNTEQEALLAWMARRNALFGYFKGTDPLSGGSGVSPAASAAAYQFILSTGLTQGYYAYPLWALYYAPENGSVQTAYGSLATDTFTPGSYGAQNVAWLTNWLDTVYSGWMGDRMYRSADPTPGDVDFGCGLTEAARLEAMPSTRTVHVPLVRSGDLAAPYTNRLDVVYPDNTTVTTNLLWPALAEGTTQTLEVPVDVANCNTAGETVTLKLYDSEGTLNATNLIACVAEEANRQRFPFWLGERTEETLNWGEWTFDLDVATNKVRTAAANGTNAWTLAVVGGTLWCPNCMQCEECLFEDPAFTAWAQSNHVALVLLDQPNMGAEGPTLLTHALGRSGSGAGRSGSYYLSRKGLTIAEGRALFDRIHDISWTRAPEGWLVEPTASRVSNPTLILIRPDGTIAGRLGANRIRENGVSTSNERFGLTENLLRLTEMFTLADDATEEANNKPGTTALPAYVYGTTNSCSLSVSDRTDVFPVSGIPAGETFRILATNSVGAKSAAAVSLLAITDAATGAYAPLPSLTASDTVWRLTQAQIDAGVYLAVSAFDDFRYATYGGDTMFRATFHTEAVPPDPGVIGFATNALEVSESNGVAVLAVERVRGSTGAVSVRIDLDPAGTTAAAGSYTWDDSDAAAHTLTWADFEFGEKYLRVPLRNDAVWTGDRTLAFTLALAGDDGAEHGETNLVVTVAEDEILSPGRLEIAATSPAAVQGMVVDVPAGGVLTLSVRRAGGSLGEAATSFDVSHASVAASTNRLMWADGNANATTGVQTVSFSLPSMAAFADNPTFTIALAPEGGTATSAAKRRVTVRVVDAEKAAFDEIAGLIETIQNGVFSQTFTLHDARFGADARVVVQTGALPKGLSADWDADAGELTVSGVVREAGEHKVTLWLESEADGETTLPVSLTVSATPLSAYSDLLTEPHSYRALPVAFNDGTASRLVGSLDVAIPLSGRLSAKYRRHDGSTTAIAFKGWEGVDADGCVYARASAREVTVSIAAAADGTFDISVTDPEFGELPVALQKRTPWSHEDPAAEWVGFYTVACPLEAVSSGPDTPLCSGGATLAWRLTAGAAASGSVSFAGTLPNGRRIGGSTYLFRGESHAELPVFSATPTDCFGGCLDVRPGGRTVTTVVNGSAETPPCWEHADRNAPELSALQRYSAHGSWIDPDTDWATVLHNHYLKTSLPFSVELGGEWQKVADVSASSGSGLALTNVADTVAHAAFEFNPATGILSGTLAGNGETISYRGVVTPGWLAGCDCGGEVDEETVVHPFGFGAWWKTGSVTYEDADGVERTRSAVVGEAVKIEVEQ